MPDNQSKMKEILQRLETERDELRLKLNLAKLEARDEWEDVEKKLGALRGRMGVVRDEAGEATGDVVAAFEVLADEVKAGFARVRKLL